MDRDNDLSQPLTRGIFPAEGCRCCAIVQRVASWGTIKEADYVAETANEEALMLSGPQLAGLVVIPKLCISGLEELPLFVALMCSLHCDVRRYWFARRIKGLPAELSPRSIRLHRPATYRFRFYPAIRATRNPPCGHPRRPDESLVSKRLLPEPGVLVNILRSGSARWMVDKLALSMGSQGEDRSA